MRNKFRIALLSMAAVGLVGCADKLADVSDDTNGPKSDEGKVYMSVAVALPSASGTRSATDEEGEGETNSNANPDFEIGYDYENGIKSIVLVLASSDGKYIAHNLIESKEGGETNTTKKYTATATFSRADITAAYSAGGPLADSKEVNIYAFCNNPDLDDYFNKLEDKNNPNWLDEVTEVGKDDEPVFFMSNASDRTVEFPASEAQWGAYDSEANPYNLSQAGPVRVERAAARFDYKKSENSTVDEVNDELTRYTYKLPENHDLSSIANVSLAKMSLVNMSKAYYNLRRVSDDGKESTADNNFKIGGVEGTGNYVVDTDWEHKSSGDHHTPEPGTLASEFNFPLFSGLKTRLGNFFYNEDSEWYTRTICSVLNKKREGEDVENENNTDNWKDKEYKIWRYVTENTIPKDVDNQIAAHSTGIVFKAAIVADEKIDEVENLSEDLKNALLASKGGKKVSVGGQTGDDVYTYPTLYLYNNQLYAGIKELVKTAAVDPTTVLYTLVNRVLGHWYLSSSNNTNNTFEYVEDDKVTEGDTRLTVEICNAILNKVTPDEWEEGDTDYTNGYEVDFENYPYNLNLKKLLVEQNFTIYDADNDPDLGGGYFCYYFYWNRHNDNGEPTNMGPMEFATVRNNVYKLSVSTISQLGHPIVPDNDPDPVKPDDPDEEDKVYMKVEVEVLPWVVRVNDIEF